ncbi:MAG: CBS domain-containing protein [Myxococcales bacterium]|nr:CBS domain-containing protein [Myxococcales bacterium]
MTKDTPIEAVMTVLPHTVGADQTIEYAQRLMAEHHIRHLPVLRGNSLEGIVSERDLALAAGFDGVNPSETTVEDAMMPVPYTVGRKVHLLEVVQEMADRKIGSALVVHDHKVVGIFTLTDAIALFARHLEEC